MTTTIAKQMTGAAAALALAACQPPDRSGGAEPAGAPTLPELESATYRGLSVSPDSVVLTDGRWAGPPFTAEGASRPTVQLLRTFRLTGDLDGDGDDEAIVLLAESAGGSGARTYLAVVGRERDGVRNLATDLLGDRVQIRAGRITRGRIELDLVEAGPRDAACCPGQLVTRGWTLAAQGLLEFDPGVPTGRLTLATIGETDWVLQAWRWDEPAPAEPEVTLRLIEGRLAGHDGCNRYFASVEESRSPGDLTVRNVISTKRACDDSAMAVESRYLTLLGAVQRFGFVGGQMALSYMHADGAGTLLFAPRPVPPR